MSPAAPRLPPATGFVKQNHPQSAHSAAQNRGLSSPTATIDLCKARGALAGLGRQRHSSRPHRSCGVLAKDRQDCSCGQRATPNAATVASSTLAETRCGRREGASERVRLWASSCVHFQAVAVRASRSAHRIEELPRLPNNRMRHRQRGTQVVMRAMAGRIAPRNRPRHSRNQRLR